MTGLRTGSVFVAVAVLWGIPFALISLALGDAASPVFIAWFRVAVGAVILMVIAGLRGQLRNIRARLGLLVAIAVCDIAVPFALVPLAEQHLSSSMTGILLATTPLFVAVLAATVRMDRLTWLGWFGLVIGFAGVVAIFGLQLRADLFGGSLAVAASVGYAVATLLVRRVDEVPALGISAVCLAIAAVLLAPVGLIDLRLPHHLSGWGALLVLGVLCTAAALALYYRLVADIGATRAALSLYLAPAVAILTGAVFLAEPITIATLAGFALILTGSWLTDRNTQTAPAPAEDPAAGGPSPSRSIS